MIHRLAVLALLGLFTLTGAHAEGSHGTAATPTITAEQAERDLRILRRALDALHPGLYRRLTPAELDRLFEDAKAEVADGSDVLEMYRLVTRIAASVRCGHTWTNPVNQPAVVRTALDALPALPFRVRFIGERILVTASTNAQVPAGSELLGIDGRTPAVLIAALWPYLRADGDSDGKRMAQLDVDAEGGALDRLLPLLFPPAAEGYRLRLRKPGGPIEEVVAPGMSVAARESALVAAGKPMHELRWRLDIENGIATLTIPTFAFWNDSFDWADFLEQAFARIRAEGVEHLILDLRDNEGGDSAIGDALIARIIETPLEIAPSRMISAYERAPYILVRYLDTWNFDFFDRTGQVRKLADGRWELLDQPKAKRIEPVADPFRGRVVMLTGPRMSSAGFLIARDFKRTRRGVLIGRATGGSLRGLNGGELTWLTLPASNVAVDIPLLAGFMPGADSDTPPPDRGIKPDQVIETRFDDAAAGRDPEHAAAVRWLRAGA